MVRFTFTGEGRRAGKPLSENFKRKKVRKIVTRKKGNIGAKKRRLKIKEKKKNEVIYKRRRQN